MSALVRQPEAVTPDNPPGREIGAETQQVGGTFGWASFVDQQEHVPELAWPQSIQTYHRMRSDSQVEALHTGTVQPIREYRWSIDPNKAPAGLVEQAAADFGLPIRGQEDDAIGRGSRTFTFDQFLDDVLLGPLYGHFHHEIVGEIQGDGWHVLKLAPRHPRTIMEFQSNAVGDLLAIRQNIAGAGGWNRMPDPIPASKLVTHVWRKEAGSHVGRSMLRSVYREWLVKDRTIRVAAINLQRGGGTPVFEGPQGASDQQIRDLAAMARSFKSAEGGGAGVPFGTRVQMVGANVPDAIGLLQYCDQCMARVWALMLLQLGMTDTGNRALGAEFALYAARFQRALAKWVCRAFNLLLDDYTEYNLGPSASHAPLLHFEQEKPDTLAVAELVAMIEAGALHVDPELEAWLRAEHGLPEMPPVPAAPELGDLSPEEVALVQNSRNPPQLPSPPSAPAPADELINAPTVAAAGPLDRTVAVPDRALRRQPTAVEAASGVDFRQMDQTHQTVLDAVQAVVGNQVIPRQIEALAAQIRDGKLTKAAMSMLKAPVLGADDIKPLLIDAARQGAHAAAAELAAQGVTAAIASDERLADLVADQATAVAELAAQGITLAAQRKAQSLVGGDRTIENIAAATASYLGGLKHQWTMDQLAGAVQLAQNVGRAETFSSADQTVLTYYSSEILDVNTCDECATVDGTQYPDLGAAMQDYAAGGYVDCAGGPRCRGTIVAVSDTTGQDGAAPQLALDVGTG